MNHWIAVGLIQSNKTNIDLMHRKIINKVCAYYNITEPDLLSKSRKKEVCKPRHVAMTLMRTMTRKSLTDIGSMLGGYDHATVLHAEKTILGFIEVGDMYGKDYLKIKSEL